MAAPPSASPSQHVVVVGGGLAGIAAACELLEAGCCVTILDKTSSLGGNSSKATCGLAVPGSKLQSKYGLEDDGADLAGLVDEGTDAWLKEAPGDVEWLVGCLGLQDELVLRETPGHQVVRTIGTKDHLPGMVIVYAAISHLKRIARTQPDRMSIVYQAEVSELLRDTQGQVCGVKYWKEGEGGLKAFSQLEGPVVLATGGYCGDRAPDGLLAQSRPDLLNLPTTNDDRTRGDGIRLASAIGAKVERLHEVQIMPTALVSPGDELNPVKLVASTAILGAGAALLDGAGERFCNEKSPLESMAEAMEKATGPFRLVIGTDKAATLEWIMEFYKKNSLVKTLGSGGTGGVSLLAKEMNVSKTVLLDSLASAVDKDGELFVGTVTPAVFSCAGGLSTDSTQAQVMGASGKIPGLFAAGEVTAAPSAKLWALPGVPLLQCIVSGRAAGKGAADVALAGKPAPQREDLRQLILTALNKESGAAPPPESAEKPQESAEKPLEEMSIEELIAKVKDLQANGVVAAAPAADAPSGPPPITMEDVAKHATKTDAWIVVNGEVIDVTKWIPIHPGGEQAICAYLGKDASEEWNMIHKPDMVQKNVANLTIVGKLGTGGGGGGGTAAAAPAKGDGIELAEVAKHNTKEDAWIVVNGQVLDVTKWIPVHPGGEAAIMAYLGADASEEWNMIHKPNMVEANLSNPNGPVVKGKFAGGSAAPPPVASGGDDEQPAPDGPGCMPGPVGAIFYMAVNVVRTILKTILFTGNLKFSFDNNRNGTIRSAMFLLFFTIVHASGNMMDLIVNNRPEEVNGEGYLIEDRMSWTGGGVCLLEEYTVMCLALHVAVALKRSWDISLNYCIHTGRLNMLFSGLTVLAFLFKHLTDIRLYQHWTCAAVYAPKYFIAFDNLLNGHLFSEPVAPGLAPPPGAVAVAAHDVYTREYELFSDLQTCLFYSACVVVFICHMVWGWKKLVPADAFQIPKDHVKTVTLLGQALAVSLGSMYLSLVWFVYFTVGPDGKGPLADQVVPMPCPE